MQYYVLTLYIPNPNPNAKVQFIMPLYFIYVCRDSKRKTNQLYAQLDPVSLFCDA